MSKGRVPRELLFGNPERVAPKVSPDASKLAYIAPDEGVLNLWCGPLGGAAKPVTRDRKRGIRSFFWAEDQKSLLYVQDKDGDENWHLYQADAGGGEVRDLTQFPDVQAQVVGTHPSRPHELLVGLNVHDKRLHDVYRVDLRDGSAKLEVENPGDVTGWLADNTLTVRVAKAQRPDGGSELRLKEGDSWRVRIGWGPEDSGGAHGFTPDDQALYLESSHESDTTVLYRFPLDGSAPVKLAAQEGSDLAGVMLHPKDFRAQAAAFVTDRLHWRSLEPEIVPELERLAQIAPGDFQPVSRDDSDRFWVVLYNRDDRPPEYWMYGRIGGAASFLFSSRPALEGYTLASMKPVSIQARDGLKLQGYLTTPPGKPAKGLPLVLLVHGGPWVRDGWGWHPEAQWLASLGCAVLQVNYRGSAGFGKTFLHAGDKEWGRKMQDDLTDAVRWAVKEGVADEKRVAIYGGSYGGYAALAAAAFTPGVFRCAVDIVGPSNLVTLIKSIPPYWEPLKRVFDLRVGSLETEEALLKERSPLFFADKIDIPLLIAQGANDPRVKQAESEQIVAALKAKGKPVEYLLFPDEGHGFARPENRLKFYEAAEKFLTTHLELE